MTAAWMVFLVSVSVVAAAAAWTAEAGLRRLDLPTRWAWFAALAAGPALLAAVALDATLPSGVGAVALGAVPVVELPGLVVGEGAGSSWLPTLGSMLAGAWVLSTLVLLTILVRSHRRLARERANWERIRILGRDVWVAPDRGPAVAGILVGWIVLPRWALELPEEELRLVLAHEDEHLRAGDARLLAGALGLLLVAPWNPVAWWQLRRLRTAMEVDCDHRVLARHPDRRIYGASLLAVAARASEPSLALAAFSERSHSLHERILTMTRTRSRWTQIAGALLLVVAVLVGVQACGVESPVAPVAEDGPEVEIPAPSPQDRAEEASISENPTFTPFTQAPSIANRAEVIRAMQAAYPPELREAGVTGTVRVFFFIDAEGRVRETHLDQSSGHEELDQAAMRVAEVYRFEPALNGEEWVPVWVSFPITFQTR